MGPRQYYVAVGTQEAKLTTLVELLLTLRSDAAVALAVACGSRDSLDQVVEALAAQRGGAFTLAVLHSDLTPAEAEGQVAQLKERLAAQEQRQREQQARGGGGGGGDEDDGGDNDRDGQRRQAGGAAGNEAPSAGAAGPADGDGQAGAGPSASSQQPGFSSSSLVLATTDVCLKALPKELLPIGLPLLVQYDIPPTKDVFTRRLSSVFGGSKDRRGRGPAQRPPVVIDFVVAGELPQFRVRERFSSAPVLEMPVHVPDIL